jgi:hypothetical protein
MLRVNQLCGFGAGLAAAPTPAFGVSFLQAVDQTIATATSDTFVAQSLGVADAARTIYAVLHWRGTSASVLSSASIGGVGATIHAQEGTVFAGAEEGVAIFSADVPTGTTGDVVVTHDLNVNRRRLALYRVLLQTAVDDADQVAISGASNTGTLTLTTAVGGALIAAYTHGTATPEAAAWTNATEQYGSAHPDHGSTWMAGALATGISGTSLAVSANLVQSGDGGFAAVSFH